MRCTSTEGLRNFWPSYRQCSRYHITVCQVNTATHAVHWLTQMLWFRKVPISYTKLKSIILKLFGALSVKKSNYLTTTVFSDTSNLLQAKERTVTWCAQCAWNKSRYPFLVWNEYNREIILSILRHLWCWLTFLRE